MNLLESLAFFCWWCWQLSQIWLVYMENPRMVNIKNTYADVILCLKALHDINSVVLQDLTRIGNVVISYILLSLVSLGLLLVGSLVSTVLCKLFHALFQVSFYKMSSLLKVIDVILRMILKQHLQDYFYKISGMLYIEESWLRLSLLNFLINCGLQWWFLFSLSTDGLSVFI